MTSSLDEKLGLTSLIEVYGIQVLHIMQMCCNCNSDAFSVRVTTNFEYQLIKKRDAISNKLDHLPKHKALPNWLYKLK